MASKIDICNGALMHVGVQPISSFTDDIESARLCNQEYAKVRRSVLSEYPWSCAEKSLALALTTTNPVRTKYDFEYTLPGDLLQVKEWLPTGFKFEVEGNVVITNETDIVLVYTFDNDNPESYDALLVETFEYRLAARLAIPLREDKGLRDRLKEDAAGVLERAEIRDSKMSNNRTQDDPSFDQDVRNIVG